MRAAFPRGSPSVSHPALVSCDLLELRHRCKSQHSLWLPEQCVSGGRDVNESLLFSNLRMLFEADVGRLDFLLDVAGRCLLPQSVSDFPDAAFLRATVLCFWEISLSGQSQICSLSRTLSQRPLKLATVFEQCRRIC